MSEPHTVSNPQLDLLSVPKSKFTLLCVGAGMMGNDVRQPIVTKGWASARSGAAVLSYSEPRGRKVFNLTSVLRNGVIVLKGHEESRPVFESHARAEGGFTSTIMDGVGGRFIDYNAEGTDALLDYLKKHLVLHTLDASRQKVTLLKELKGDAHTREVADPNFREKLFAALGPATEIGASPPQAPDRKSLLTDVMKAKLRAAVDSDPIRPLFKIFTPDGGGTWLLCSLEDDMDTLWAICDIGQGCVEYGTVSLKDLETTRGGFKMHAERDIHFDGSKLVLDDLLNQPSLRV